MAEKKPSAAGSPFTATGLASTATHVFQAIDFEAGNAASMSLLQEAFYYGQLSSQLECIFFLACYRSCPDCYDQHGPDNVGGREHLLHSGTGYTIICMVKLSAIWAEPERFCLLELSCFHPFLKFD